jgi:anti-sigma factor RsiW
MNEDAFLRGILSVHRGHESEAIDPRFAEARGKAESNSGLTQWWEREKEVDRMIGAKLASVAVPADLKARLISRQKISPPLRPRWTRAALLAAACLVALAVLFGSWRGPFQPAVSLADYRDEMVGFIRVDPTLEMKSPELAQLTSWLQRKKAPSQLSLPKKLQGLESIGCRTLRFRGHDVTLICFKRKEGGLLHLFVVNRAALPGVGKSGSPQIAPQDDWMTAAWREGDMIYLMAAQGDQSALESYLGDA